MPLTPAQIIADTPVDLSTLQRIAHRTRPIPLTIVDPNPHWPQRFQQTKSRLESVLDPTTIVSLEHVGSTSVPGLPAKDVIDIDLVVSNIHDEASYVPQLESVGLRFLFREPGWHDHRFFIAEGPDPEGSDAGGTEESYYINLHVFGPDCPDVEKHRIFRDWLLHHPEDRDEYAAVKREAAAASSKAGEGMAEYTVRKDQIVEGILEKAFRELGYIQ